MLERIVMDGTIFSWGPYMLGCYTTIFIRWHTEVDRHLVLEGHYYIHGLMSILLSLGHLYIEIVKDMPYAYNYGGALV